ncbi:MAG TPA: hypothetical protein VHK06_08280, partial [Candidatus Limnocylindria bacterium]|nr:hypothetical protein [Candidatus Limnocylindria bacterium]
VSEVMTGGGSASDEFVEIYNPTLLPLPLEGLELIYVTASGTTLTRRASWAAGAAVVAAHGHHLLANDAGVFAGIADTLYSGGMAAAGGSVALRIQGAASALDAVGWGTATAWLEGAAAPAPPAGESIERLPGGDAGSQTDTDQNAVDFVVRAIPDPQNAGSAPVPGGTPTPTPTPAPTVPTTPAATLTPPPPLTPTPTTSPSPTPSTGPTPATTSIGEARGQPDGTRLTVRGVSLSSSGFTDGGGFIADATGGIAVLPEDGSFPRGVELTVTGEVDDRYSQRTIRAAADGVVIGLTAAEPEPAAVSTGTIGEQLEGRLVRVRGSVQGTPSELASGLAYDIDDGSGAVRVLVGGGTGIDTSDWLPEVTLDLVGIASQRDTAGSGVAGYRVLPRDSADVVSVSPPPGPSASPPGSPSPQPSEPAPSDAPGEDGPPLISIAEARAAETGTRVRVRGVVTIGSGLVDPTSAVIQDSSGGMLLRLGDEAGRVRRGEAVEVSGTRSTKSGMLTIRVANAPRRLGDGAEPSPRRLATGEAAEALEAQLIVARGAVVESARRSSAGSVTLDIDDGSGALRVHLLAALGADRSALTAGTWIEVTGVLGQQTTGAQPDRGYRIWPRSTDEVRVLAPATDGAEGDTADGGGADGDATPGGPETAPLEVLLPGAPAGGPRTADATLVAGPWPELGVAGVLWDGTHALGVADDAGGTAAVAAAIARRAPPLAVRVTASRAVSRTTTLALPVVALPEARALEPTTGRARAPLARLPAKDVAAWVRVAGRVSRDGPGLALSVADRRVLLSVLCRGSTAARGLRTGEIVEVEGLADGPDAIGVPCGGVRRAPALLGAVPAAASPAERTTPQSGDPAADSPALGVLPLLLGASSTAGGALLGTLAWRLGSFARLRATLAAATALDHDDGSPQPPPGMASDGPESADAPSEPRPQGEPEPRPRLTVVHVPPGSGS